MSKTWILLSCVIGLSVASLSSARAQVDMDAGVPEGAVEARETMFQQGQPSQPEKNRDMRITEKARQQSPDPGLNDLLPLLFLKDEYVLLQDAKAKFVTRPPTASEINQTNNNLREQPVDPGIRELSLAGIVYRGKKDWTIWFNEQRITPNAIPKEVLDLRVYRDYIEVKWYDEYNNLIFPIRLRPHQRFNLDSRLFLPG